MVKKIRAKVERSLEGTERLVQHLRRNLGRRDDPLRSVDEDRALDHAGHDLLRPRRPDLVERSEEDAQTHLEGRSGHDERRPLLRDEEGRFERFDLGGHDNPLFLMSVSLII